MCVKNQGSQFRITRMKHSRQALLKPAVDSCSAPIPVARPYMPLTDNIVPYLQVIDKAGWYSNFGPLNQQLEIRLAERFEGETHVVTVANATSGISLALRALDLPKGAWCALPSWTFVATAHAIIEAGLKPLFVDVDPVSGMLDPDACHAFLRYAPGRVAAIVPVCAYGAPMDLPQWIRFQDETGVKVVIDAAAAHDTVTSAALPVVVSLHATKVLGAGEGGYVASNDPIFCNKIRSFSSFGFNGSRDSVMPATNAKMSEYAAAVALAGMDNWASTRLLYQQAGIKLRAALMDVPEVEFQDGWASRWVTSVCVVRLPNDSVATVTDLLNDNGISTRLWWGRGCHTSPAFARVARTPLPNTDHLAQVSLGLPYSALMSEDEINRVADLLRQFFRSHD